MWKTVYRPESSTAKHPPIWIQLSIKGQNGENKHLYDFLLKKKKGKIKSLLQAQSKLTRLSFCVLLNCLTIVSSAWRYYLTISNQRYLTVEVFIWQCFTLRLIYKTSLQNFRLVSPPSSFYWLNFTRCAQAKPSGCGLTFAWGFIDSTVQGRKQRSVN